jgi:glycine cleavage system H protein
VKKLNPEQLLYSETHEWVSVESTAAEKVATVGISAFAIEQLTDLVYMQLPAVGKHLAKGSEFGEVESVKAVSSLYSPVEGDVVAVNDDLPKHLEQLTTDPYGAGWLVRIKVTNENSLAGLMDHAAYQKQCAEHG